MATTAELRIPVVVDGRTVLASFAQIEAAARQAAGEAAKIGDLKSSADAQRAAAQAYKARVAAARDAANQEEEFDRRTTALAIKGIEDEKERRLVAVRQTLQAEEAALNAIIAKRLAAGKISQEQAQQQREYVQQIAAEARAVQLAGPVDGAAAQGGRSSRVGVNAQGALTSLAQGLQDATFARNFGDVIRYSGNNVQQFATQLGYAAAAAKASGETLKSGFVAALTGGGGVVLGITAALALLPVLIGLLNRQTAAQQRAAEAARAHAAALESQREQIAATIRDLRRLRGAQAFSAVENLRDDAAEQQSELRRIDRVLAEKRAQLLLIQRAPVSERSGLGSVLTREIEALEADRVASLNAVASAQTAVTRAEKENAGNLGFRRAALEAEAAQLGDIANQTGAQAARQAQVNRELRETRDLIARNTQSGDYDPETIADRAAAAARRAATDARRDATAARREANRDTRESRQDAALRAELEVAASRDGLAREIAAAQKLRDERLTVERQTADGRIVIEQRTGDLRLAIEAAYQRDVSRLRQADERTRTERELSAIEAVRDARDRVDAALGAGQDELAQRRIQTLRGDALQLAAIVAEQAKAVEGVEVNYADLVRIIQQGTLADAEALALRVDDSAELRKIVDLTTERVQLEAQIAGRARERRLEDERTARSDADRTRALEARRDDAERRLGLRGRGASVPDATAARDELARALAALADVDTALALARQEEAARAAALASASRESVDVVASRAAEAGETVRQLTEEQRAAAARVADAEVTAAERSAAAVEASYERKRDAARRFAEAAIADLQDAFQYERRYTDLQVEIQQDRYKRELEALDERLRDEQLTRAEYDLERRRVLAEQAEFEKDLEADRASFVERSVSNLTDHIIEEINRQIAAAVAAAAVRLFLNIISGGGFSLFPQASFLQYASGGAVAGPGGPQDDRVAALLSNGEHVLTAEEVARMGGHASVYRMRTLAMTGALPRFAYGGPVGAVDLRPPMPRYGAGYVSADTSPALDLSPLAARLDAVVGQVASLATTVERTSRENADRISGTYADPSAARRQRGLATRRDRFTSSRPARDGGRP